ncbi:hypothetical protein BU23DRAFT_628221 [Bimuria novae-zelandiae CBS 107.79]|uniref:Uncharacterized protein n=1 Tax=Bimuria novae-zelandiae CBS 107.79 TaxID=1447943 RepID=A0A6A5VTL8_9PLEO|nr:hypothetical protein BU23DRAFT_628221 [Bimuria novae-zelandiae CBS 107.79]
MSGQRSTPDNERSRAEINSIMSIQNVLNTVPVAATPLVPSDEPQTLSTDNVNATPERTPATENSTASSSSKERATPALPSAPATNAARKTITSRGGVSKPSAVTGGQKDRKKPSGRKPVTFTEEDDERILHAWFQGNSETETAKDVGNSLNAIVTRIRLLSGVGSTRHDDKRSPLYLRLLQQYNPGLAIA